MATLFEFSQAISKLNKEKKFAEALKYFNDGKNEFTPQQIGSNKYIVSSIITAYIEKNRYDDIFTFVEQYNVALDPKDFPFLLKKLKNKQPVKWTVVNKFCDLVSVDSLDTECRTTEVEQNGVKKTIELASSKEEWYATKTKALFETKQYQECLELSKKALESIKKFHYSNEVWFARRIALSKKHLGNTDEALTELLQILKRKNEWYIQNEIAQIYKENGEYEKAFEFAISAINNSGELKSKVELIVLIAELLALKEEKELSFKHYSLSKLLRQQEGWSIPSSVYSALPQFSFEQITTDKLADLIRELKKYWNSFKPQQNALRQNTTQRQTGKIDRILHNNEKGADGFIKYDGNKSVYFQVNATDEIFKKIAIGIEVEFKILPAKDGKKEKAIHLKIKSKDI